MFFFLQYFSCSVFRPLFAVFFPCAFSWSQTPGFSPDLFLSFCAFGCLWCVYPASFLLSFGLYQFLSGSASLLWHPLHFPICLCFSPVLVFSPPFPSDILGFVSVLRVANSPAVLAVALPFFVLLFPLRVFRLLRFRLLLAVFLGIFPHAVATAGFFRSSFAFSTYCGYGCPFLSSSAFPSAAAPAASSGLHPRFPHAVPPATPFAFGALPAVFRAKDSPFAVPRGSGYCFSLHLCSFLLPGLCRMI